jgi:hypothetical protein
MYKIFVILVRQKRKKGNNSTKEMAKLQNSTTKTTKS